MPGQYADSRPITLPADESKPVSDHYTLRLVVQRVNELIVEQERKKQQQQELEQRRRQEHEAAVREAADRLNFD